jgi:nucleotide-binding universal stress UspA family protein
MTLGDILVPGDGTEETYEGLAMGAGLAEGYAATLHLLVVPGRERRRRSTDAVTAGSDVVDEAMARIASADADVEAMVVSHGRFDTAVRGYAAARDVDLVVTPRGEATPHGDGTPAWPALDADDFPVLTV